MPHQSSAKSFTGEIGALPTRLHCTNCDAPQMMQINGVYPALFCGKDIVFYECLRCGTERTEKVDDLTATSETQDNCQDN
jgi:hypothetical protein